ncbi:MAG TPA: peptidoglycan-binding domain-containing protein, partial [Gaiellaceae bacterium]|nr:peptidoglycan-binding domain-containing protein [Gaiellaceae bacterium]
PPRAVFLHTNGGGPHLTPWFDQLFQDTHQRVGSTFQIYANGSIDQLCDTESIIYAQFGASRWAVSVETEDDGHSHTPWTPKQLAAIHRLLTWLHEEHDIPRRAMANENDAGIGYHQQFPVYNRSGHDCPGPVRVNQLVHTVIPRLNGGLHDMSAHRGAGHDERQNGGHSHVPQPVGPLPLPWLRRDADTATWQRQMLARGWSKIGDLDGVYGPHSKAVCELFQQEKDVPVTGTVDARTWALAWTAPITH